MPDILPTINNEPPQGIQALLDTVYLWNPDVANDLIEKINELLAKLGDVSGTIPPYSALEAPVQQYTPCYNGDNVYVAARDLEELPAIFDPTEWILIATKAPVLQAGTGISIDGNEISVTSEISSGAAAGATAVQPGDLATVATSGDYDDLLNKPTLGTAAAADTTDFATATQGGKADTALQPTNVIDNLNSESSTDVLSANQGRVLESQIVALEGRGRYLSSWNCSTGLAGTNPPSSPYVYKAGDYFIVSAVGSTNYRPSGTQYVTGVASSVVETEDVAVNDTYTFDGTNWSLLKTSKVDALPPQTGNAGKFLTTDGTDASWETISFPVSSVNNKTGAVTLNAADVGATLVTFRTWGANE